MGTAAWKWFKAGVPVVAMTGFLACGGQPRREVVVYTSVDQVYAEPILKAFEKAEGIKVLAVYDVEAAKSTGLANRLLAEKKSPKADVFWSSEVSQTLRLAENGVLAPFFPPSASDVPPEYRDPKGFWTGMGLRGRILLCNSRRLSPSRMPRSLEALLLPELDGADIGIANPLFGTSSTHMAALYASMAPEKARSFYKELRDKGAKVLDGNSVVRDLVASGDVAVGLTDTDDAQVALDSGAPVEIVYPGDGGSETLYVPNSVAVVSGAPHAEAGRRLCDFLTSAETERKLVSAKFLCASVRNAPRGLKVSWQEVGRNLDLARRDATGIFLR